MATSAFWKAVFEAESTDEQPLALLDITNPDLAGTLRLVNDIVPVTTNDTLHGTTVEWRFTVESDGHHVKDFSGLNEFSGYVAGDYFNLDAADANFRYPENKGAYRIKEVLSSSDVIVWDEWKPVTHDDASQPGLIDIHTQHVYDPFPFNVVLPSEAKDRDATATLTVDAVDRSIIEVLLSIETAPEIKITVVLRSDPNTVEFETPVMLWPSVEFDARSITGQLIATTTMNRTVSKLSKTPHLRPGIHTVRQAA